MIDEKRINEIIDLKKWHEKCGGVLPDELEDELIDILGKSEKETTEYFERSTTDQLDNLSEIFEDLSELFQSTEFVDRLEALAIKYPQITLAYDITEARKVLSN